MEQDLTGPEESEYSRSHESPIHKKIKLNNKEPN